MSTAVLNNCGIKVESFEKQELLEKCGEIFLEKQLGNLIYLCSLCDDRFREVELFSKHISDEHVSVDSFISFDPNESDEEPIESYDQTDDDNKEALSELEQNKEVVLVNEDKDESDMLNNEEIFGIIDSSNTVLDIEVYEDSVQLELELKVNEDETPGLESEEMQTEAKSEENPIEIDVDSVEVSELEDAGPEDDTVNVVDGGNELDVANASDKEILCSKIRCKHCGDTFDYVKDLRKHDCGLNQGKKLHHCTECGKVFKKKSGLDIHIMAHKGEKPHKCDICGAAYACKQNLIVHVRRHTGEKPFKCNFCDRRFASSTEKISHMRTHTGERPFVCDMCGKAHTSSSQLTEHMYRHLDIRNHACEICEKRFRNSYNLRMHRLTHEDAPRKFTCEHCLSAFKTHSNLLQHIKIHQKVKKYVCKICGRAFAQHPGLYSHMKSHAIFK